MDLQTERAVWQRVKSPGGITAEEAVLPERLEGLVVQELSDASALRFAARRIRGQGSAALNRAAAKTDARVRELTTMHYLLTGRRLRLKAPPHGPAKPLPEALRELTLRSRQSARTYESLQAEFSEYARDFARFAADARAQTQILTQTLQTQLPPK